MAAEIHLSPQGEGEQDSLTGQELNPIDQLFAPLMEVLSDDEFGFFVVGLNAGIAKNRIMLEILDAVNPGLGVNLIHALGRTVRTEEFQKMLAAQREGGTSPQWLLEQVELGLDQSIAIFTNEPEDLDGTEID